MKNKSNFRGRYFNKEIFIKENKKFLKNNWYLVGVKHDFKKKKDFFTFELFGYKLILYYFGDNNFKVFSNVCLHRGSIIKKDIYGNGSLVCPYHYWSYSQDGRVNGVPNKKEIFSPNFDKLNLKLEEWNIDFCGNLIFVSHSSNKKSLSKYLGSKYNDLHNCSGLLGTKVKKFSWIWNLNWKLAVENSIDEYHAIYAHLSTFKRTLKLKPEYSYSDNVYSMSMPLNDITNKGFSKYKKYLDRYLKNKYTHHHIFPYNSISTTSGIHFFIQSYMPLSENKTLVESSIYINKNFEKGLSENIIKYLNDSSIKFNEEVFSEDKLLCESIRDGLRSNNKSNLLYGKFEDRINFFLKKTML